MELKSNGNLELHWQK